MHIDHILINFIAYGDDGDSEKKDTKAATTKPPKSPTCPKQGAKALDIIALYLFFYQFLLKLFFNFNCVKNELNELATHFFRF